MSAFDEAGFKGVLLENEELLWEGRPADNKSLSRKEISRILQTLVLVGLLGVVLAWAVEHHMWDTLVIASLVGFAFLNGLFRTVGLDFLRRRSARYAVTNFRVLVWSQTILAQLETLLLPTVSDVLLAVDKRGVGTISFKDGSAVPKVLRGFMDSKGIHFHDSGPLLERIENAEAVYDLIIKATRDWKSAQRASADRSEV